MTSQHQATPDEWAQQADWAQKQFSSSSCIVELLHRVEALEAIDHHPLVAAVRAQSKTVAHLGNRVERLEELHVAIADLNQRFSLDPLVARIEALELALRAQAGLLTTDEQTELGVMPASDANLLMMDAAKRAASEARKHAYHLIRNISNSAVVVEGSFEIGGKSYTYKGEAETAASPQSPALVERVANALYSVPYGSDTEARAAIREVAAAALQMYPDPNLTWERVALWLEQEANK